MFWKLIIIPPRNKRITLMILKTPNSRVYIVNLLSDFILSKISKEEESIITIADCMNFYVVKGKTTSNKILDLSSICDEFSEKYKLEKPISHTIDLIEYDCKLGKLKEFSFTLHNSENCSYSPQQIKKFINDKVSCDFDYEPIEISDDLLIITSEFPHGYSLGQGRLLYFYGKHIFYSIPSNYPISTLTLKISELKNEDGENKISIINSFTQESDESLKSAILDVFDFDMNWLSIEMKKVDWSLELTNPLEEYSFVKKKNKDFIIL